MSVRNIVKSIQDIMRQDVGVDGDAQRISQLCWMFFLKIIDDQDQELEQMQEGYRSPIPAKFRWRAWAANPEGMTGEALLAFINDELFPALKSQSSTVRRIGATAFRAIEQARGGKVRFDLLANAASSSGRNWSISRRYPIALLAAGKADRAYEDVLRQLTGHPFRAESWHLLGQIAEQLRQPKVAAHAYTEAADRDVRDDASRARLAGLRASF